MLLGGPADEQAEPVSSENARRPRDGARKRTSTLRKHACKSRRRTGIETPEHAPIEELGPRVLVPGHEPRPGLVDILPRVRQCLLHGEERPRLLLLLLLALLVLFVSSVQQLDAGEGRTEDAGEDDAPSCPRLAYGSRSLWYCGCAWGSPPPPDALYA